MYSIKLPNLNWFLFGNVYSGSICPDPYKPCIGQTVFNYRVRIVETSKEKSLVAVCFFTLGWNASSNMDESIIARFEVSSFGLEVAQNWLESKFFGGINPCCLIADLQETNGINAQKKVKCLC